MKQARGMRNNNPLNIIKSEKINWQGEVKPSTDPNFAQFETLEYGLRAAFKLLRTYYQKHGCVRTVCKHTGLNPDQQLPPMKEETKVMWCDIVLAMATMECGLSVKQQEELVPFIDRGWEMKK